MTTVRKGGPSRPGSSRATSVVGEIRRKRAEKPYKTEKTTALVKKKKLKLETSYARPPTGYTFVAVGTPDLAERCKELSRQQGLGVNVVNAKPVSTHAKDPHKVSHHIHRIGYHFKAEIVDQASEELGYVYHRGRFIKETDLQAQYQQSYIANVMKRNGLVMDQTTKQESPSQVRAAIKELFPKIPDEDLEQIVEHAWKEGTSRVGTNSTLELPRRVQLATIARIRHKYTDYDYLLKAFEWKDARKEVEPKCLEKLIEWRGENDVEDDNELEEIVRETIVIDDDDDDENGVINLISDGEADDEDSDAELGDTSDASIEFTHRLAAEEDLRPESANEASNSFFGRSQPWPRRTEQHTHIARQKIGEARRLLRRNPPAEAASNVSSVLVPVDGRGAAPDTVMVDGQLYLREAEPRQVHAPPPYMQYPDQPSSSRGVHHAMQSEVGRNYPSPFAPTRPNGADSFNHAVPSIEPHIPASDYERQSQSLLHGAPPPTAGGYLSDKRRRIDYSPNHSRSALPTDNYRPSHHFRSNGHSARTPPRTSHVIDLTTPERNSRSGNPSPMRDVQPAFERYETRGHAAQRQSDLDDGRMYERPPVGPSAQMRVPPDRYHQIPVEPEPYDPRQPMLNLPEPPARFVSAATLTPQPVHGAPAPVQQVPLGGGSAHSPSVLNNPNYPTSVYVQHPPPLQAQPVYGAPHPAQYYTPR